MQCFPSTKASRRYTVRIAITMFFYLVLLAIAQWTFHHLHPSGPVIYILAVLPALPLVASLAEDSALLRSFLRWLDVAPPRGEPLHLVEQRLPGETDDRPETSESDTRRLPADLLEGRSAIAEPHLP